MPEMVPAATPTVNGGPGCSGQPDRIDRLGYPVDISRWMVPVADRRRSKAGVSSERRGLVQKTHASTGSTTRIQVLRALHRPSIWPVPARTGEVVGQRSCSRRTFGFKHCRALSEMSEHGRRIGQQTAPGEAHPCATCRWCHVPLVPHVALPRAGRQSDISNFEILNFELEWGVGGKSNRRLKNHVRVLRPTLAYK
ncbi:hypothetical protein TIFTF001_038207 [Ficus carica]|uniref:Uncharacterized protein n=1 Tax=Ficus carica TaxID=3494 RepID=A0AA88J9Q8_FICCA|nr:hypothetical protein TIFTF001_038207 [Ficus carica]